MTRLSDLRHAAYRTRLVWALACLVVAQALFPIQLHTRFVVDDAGEVVQICTLKGTKTVVIDPASGQQQVVDQHHDDDRSPACAFSHLIAGALVTAAVVLPGWLDLAAVTPDPLPIKAPPAPSLRHAPIRAPPALS